MSDPTDPTDRIDQIIDLAEKRAKRSKAPPDQESLDLSGGRNLGFHAVAELLHGKPPVANVSNCLIILAHDPAFAGMLGYSEFILSPLLLRSPPPPDANTPELPGPYPRPWSAEDAALVLAYIQRIWLPKAKKGDVQDAMFAVASQHRFHPVRDWLADLRWDNKPRIDDWLRHAFCCDDSEYHQAIAAKFLIAAVRRIRRPGCKFDQLVILEGDEGIGKSRACKALFGSQWFSDNLHSDLSSRDAPISLAGVWGVELGEIQHFIRNDKTVIKAFLSRGVDRYRPINGRFVIDVPRQSVFIGTTNQSFYLEDETGNRRIWPVLCRDSRVEWIKENREQLWAEAATREAAGEPLWISDPFTSQEAKSRQADRMMDDSWVHPIIDYLALRQEVRVADILFNALHIPHVQQRRSEQMRVAAILKGMGWTWKNVRNGNQIYKLWMRPP